MTEWIKGMPPVEVVEKHEREHPGRTPPRVRFRRLISVAYKDSAGGKEVQVENSDSCGTWLCIDPGKHGNRFTSPCVIYLRAVNGEILLSNGLAFWQPLAETQWADRSEYFPVDARGMPVGYEKLTEENSKIRVALAIIGSWNKHLGNIDGKFCDSREYGCTVCMVNEILHDVIESRGMADPSESGQTQSLPVDANEYKLVRMPPVPGQEIE